MSRQQLRVTAQEDDEQLQDQYMLDINLEPPTPLEAGASLRFNQSTSNAAGSTLSAFHQSQSPRSTTSDHTFAWQDSPDQNSSCISRPTSTSGWSVSGTSISGDDSLFATSDNSSSPAKSSPSQVGKSKSHARKKAPGHVSRPRNAFILFRSHAITNKIIPPSLGVKDNRAVSCIVATLWKSLPDDERKQWKMEAEKEKELHRQQYPDYQFKPGNCGTKGKVRTHAKTEETVKEQCEMIADQILRAHGRSPTREEGEARKKKEAAAKRTSNRNKDGLPRARKNAPALRGKQVNDTTIPENKEVEVEVKEEDDAEEYEPPIALAASRRRSSSLPGIHGVQRRQSSASIDMFASWQARVEQQHIQPPTLHQESASQNIDFHQPWQQSLAGRRCVNPAALRFTVPASLGDASFASPRTITSNMAMSAPSPRFALFNVPDRPVLPSPTSTRRFEDPQYNNSLDATLLSPIKSSFYDSRSGNMGWQSWSRYSYADIALPPMKPRQSIDGSSSRRNSILNRPSQGLYQDVNDGIFPQADGHLSLHHNFFSPTYQSFHQRYADYKSHSEESIDVDMPDTPLRPVILRPVKAGPSSTLADADTTPSLGRLTL